MRKDWMLLLAAKTTASGRSHGHALDRLAVVSGSDVVAAIEAGHLLVPREPGEEAPAR
jgi:hypothetical protein